MKQASHTDCTPFLSRRLLFPVLILSISILCGCGAASSSPPTQTGQEDASVQSELLSSQTNESQQTEPEEDPALVQADS